MGIRPNHPATEGRSSAEQEFRNSELYRVLILVGSWFSSNGLSTSTYNPIRNNRYLLFVWRLYAGHVSPTGQWFIGLTTLLAFYTAAVAIGPGVPSYVPLTYALVLWLMAGLCSVLLRPKVSIQTQSSDRVSAGSVLQVWVEVVQNGRIPGVDLVALPYRLPRSISAVPPDGTVMPLLERGQRAHVEVGLLCRRRGAYTLHGYRIRTDYPFGLFYAYRTFKKETNLFVLPNFTPLHDLQIEAGRRYHPGGVAMASQLGESLEYIGNREFRDGDNVRDIDWRATARLNVPILREYREEYYHRVAVILDTQLEFDWINVAKINQFERAVSLTAAVSDYMARQEYIVDLFAAGTEIYHLTAGRSLAYIDQILEILACVEETSESTLLQLAPEIMQYLSQITTIVCIFLDWTEDRRDFARRLAMDGAAIKIVVVRDGPTTLDTVSESELGSIRLVRSDEFDGGMEVL